jgi:structural maintenance of chromosomes protein 6
LLDARRADNCNKWKRFLEVVAKIVKQMFHYHLSKKGHTGSIEFDHANGSLTLNVATSTDKNVGSTSDTKALSGGERSFATLAFVMSIGEVRNLYPILN